MSRMENDSGGTAERLAGGSSSNDSTTKPIAPARAPQSSPLPHASTRIGAHGVTVTLYRCPVCGDVDEHVGEQDPPPRCYAGTFGGSRPDVMEAVEYVPADRAAELEAALQRALLCIVRQRNHEAESGDDSDESLGVTLALNREIRLIEDALKGEEQ